MKNTVIFDLDGTLLYTLEDLNNSVNYALAEFSLPSITESQTRSFIGNGVKKLIERAVNNKLNNEDTEKCLSIFKEHYKNNMYVKTKPYDGVIELLDKLKNKGYKTAVVSNKFDKAVKELCEFYFGKRIDLAKGECLTTKKKPDPDGIFQTVNELSVEVKNCVYVGDSEVDILTAQNAEMDCICVDWGYKDREFLKQNGAKIIVSNCNELYETILNF